MKLVVLRMHEQETGGLSLPGSKRHFRNIEDWPPTRLLDGILSLYGGVELTNAPTGVAAFDTLYACTLTLIDTAGVIRHQDIPLLSLWGFTNRNRWKEFVPFPPDWPASYVRINNSFGGNFYPTQDLCLATMSHDPNDLTP